MWCEMSIEIKICIIIVLNLFTFETECRRVKRVVGGMEVECGTQPQVASLRDSKTLRHLCGATILTSNFALTAAHCVEHDASQYILQLNNLCGNGPPPIATVLGVITYDLYDKVSNAHDIAVLRIRLYLDDITWLGELVLPNSSFGISGECTIYGYGSRVPGSEVTSEVLLAGKMMMASLDECTESLGPIAPAWDSGMMCAGGGGTDACQGDSGSPLVCCGSCIEGISSYGLSCGLEGVPGVYTSVGAHLRWIRGILQGEVLRDHETEPRNIEEYRTANENQNRSFIA